MNDTSNLESTVRRLADRAEIGEVLARYASSIDLRDWARLESCLTPDVTTDYGELGRHTNREHVVRSISGTLPGFDATHHMITNHEIAIDGDTARTRAYLNVIHYLSGFAGGDHVTLRGHYEHEWVRTPDGWRIRRLVLTTTWREGDLSLFHEARRRWHERRAEQS